MSPEVVFVLLFVVASGVAVSVRWLHIPYTVGLVLAGLLLGMVHAFPAPELTKDLLFSVFLPGLIFEAAFHIDFEELRRNWVAVVSLAVPGVVVATGLTTAILARASSGLGVAHGFEWRHALVFGALISATDPIAVVAVFRRLGVPRRLSLLLEGESLLNDGTSIVFFTLSLAFATGREVAPAGLAVDFVSIVGIGAAVGTAVGLAVSQVIRQVNDPMVEITLTTIAAYGAFVAAEHFHYSGVIAVAGAGMLCGNYTTRVGMSPSTRIAVESFWEYVAFSLNSIVFLLIGFEVRLNMLLESWPMILLAYTAVTTARGAVILAASALLRPTRERVPWPWAAVLTWGGLRGALPIVLALSLPPGFAYRDLLVAMTFGVALLSITVHGLTMSPLLRWVGVATSRMQSETYEYLRGRLQSADAALGELERLPGVRFGTEGLLDSLRETYQERIRRTQEKILELDLDMAQLRTEEIQWARRHLLTVEKDRAFQEFRKGALSRAAYDRLLAEIDARFLRLESGEEGEGGQATES